MKPFSAVCLSAFLLAASTAHAAEPAPQPRALYPRFNVELFPRVGGQGVVGIRPAEIARYATSADVQQASSLVFGMFCQLLGGHHLDGPSWPTFADLEECVCCLELRVIAPAGGDEKATFILGGKTPGMLRAVRPFDWEGMLRKSIPYVATARHAGRKYLRIANVYQIALPYLGRFGEPNAVYLPDDRTFVIGAESEIRGLLDRLASRKPGPEPVPGWSEVDRDLVALAFDNRRTPLVSGRFPADYVAGKELEALAGSLESLAVGLSTSQRTRVRFVAAAKDEVRASTAARALRELVAVMLEVSADNKTPDIIQEFGAALLKSAVVERRGAELSGVLAADGNIVKVLFSLLRGPL
jgi:hypothetical protein